MPDVSDQPTSDHGFDLNKTGTLLEPIIRNLKDQDIRVSLFMDPDLRQIQLAKEVGADRIELYTGPYAGAFDEGCYQDILEQHQRAGQLAHEIGLGVNAGHDLNLKNLPEYRSVPYLAEVSIGHAFTLDCLQTGIESTMQDYLAVLA